MYVYYIYVYGEQKPTEGPYMDPRLIYGPRAHMLCGPRAPTVKLQTLAFAAC